MAYALFRKYRKTVEDFHSIDVREWAREGKLREPTRWRHDLGAAGAISVSANHDEVTLSYLRQRLLASPIEMREVIKIDHTPCNFGGARKWFVCPTCHHRRAKLIMGAGGAKCRKCYRLPYESQNLSRYR